MTPPSDLVLSDLVARARELLADPRRGYDPGTGYARRCGQAEELLRQICGQLSPAGNAPGQ